MRDYAPRSGVSAIVLHVLFVESGRSRAGLKIENSADVPKVARVVVTDLAEVHLRVGFAGRMQARCRLLHVPFILERGDYLEPVFQNRNAVRFPLGLGPRDVFCHETFDATLKKGHF